MPAIAGTRQAVGCRGGLHENPAALSAKEQERSVLERGPDALDASPTWDYRPHTVGLLLDRRRRYVRSLVGQEIDTNGTGLLRVLGRLSR